jgi:ParB family chromosome partitioning protein
VPDGWSHNALACRVGAWRETVTRGLATLAKAGVIRRHGRRIILLANDDADVDTGSSPVYRRSEPVEHQATALHSTGVPSEVKVADRPGIVWLPLDQIDEPSSRHNSRGRYTDVSISELAASLRRDGVLQPLCVRPKGSRYELVFGVRRFRAAKRAGLHDVPCTIRTADDGRAFLLNSIENLQREQLSSGERIRAIERLAATGLGVREIGRRTGFNPSTISRWLGITGRPELRAALEEGRIELAQAILLAEAPRSQLAALIQQAPSMPTAALRRRVAALRRDARAERGIATDRQYLYAALRCLRAISSTREGGLIDRLWQEVERLAPELPAHALEVDYPSVRDAAVRAPVGRM